MAQDYTRIVPEDTRRITTGCQYCAVGCGYNAFLVGESAETRSLDGVSRFITPAMRNKIRYRGKAYDAAVAPDVRCDLNKGNHSVRGGSQGENLVAFDGSGRSTKQRLRSPLVRLSDGKLHEITWAQLYEVMARLVIKATRMEPNANRDKIRIRRREALGVKIYEYQYLENTYSATKLFYTMIGTPNVAYHDRPSASGSSPGMADVGFRPHDFAYDDVRSSDVLLFTGTNPYENQSVFFMQYCQGKPMIVIDPRRTATAEYAVRTGGLHLQPTKLGADSLVLYALARQIIASWLEGGQLNDFPLDDRLGKDVSQLPVENDDQRRRASRAATFQEFANKFLKVGDATSPYTLENAEAKSGIPRSQLQTAAKMLFDPGKSAPDQPKVGMFYEKGLIWGFNYHNTAAVGSLGLLLRAYSEAGRFVGRVGGHQKGWAESRTFKDLEFVARPRSAKPGYPFFASSDTYSDEFLVKLKKNDERVDSDIIRPKHNLDNHVFGPPPGFEHDDQTGVRPGFVRLRNILVTKSDPDVRMLWIIGNNCLAQSNDTQRKREELLRRLQKGSPTPGQILRSPLPDEGQPISVESIVEALGQRIDKGGVVVVHQEIFANPTTELCDLVIPAAGWGEDDFIRYNAQRRLKLYARFQDMPLHQDDDGDGDPMVRIDDFRHSPKPDWVIFRDIAQTIGRVLDTGESNYFEDKMRKAFPWCDSSELCDEMSQLSNRHGMLGDLYWFGKAKGIPVSQGILHRVLGKKAAGEPEDGLAPLLRAPNYTIPGQGEVYGNSIATNGVLLPVRLNKDTETLEGTLSQAPSGKFFFIRAPWHEIEPFYEELIPRENELFITNGRFNHLWNNMFHHLRNEYVNERYPEDLPGTILEVNPDWAASQGIQNGQVVEIRNGAHRFVAIASRQSSLPPNGAFAMFSYPVHAGQDEEQLFTFDGYVNNATNGYADGINAIGALKYGRAAVSKAAHPQTGAADWIFPRDFPARAPRLGPTFEQRNQLGPAAPPPNRLDWEMRELIVAKGLPRAFLKRSFSFGLPPHFITSGPESLNPVGSFWRIPGLTPDSFLNMRVFGERIGDALIDRLKSDMPSGMLQSDELASNAHTTTLLERLEFLLSHRADFGDAELAEAQSILDLMIDTPHRTVVEKFLVPDEFLTLLKANAAVRQRMMARLNTDRRRMFWHDGHSTIDEWQAGELAIARKWFWDQP